MSIFEIHVIQNFPYNNANRGENGEPKTLTFGGTKRSRISSQCWKHFTRKLMTENNNEFGFRTKFCVSEIMKRITNIKDEDFKNKIAQNIFAAAMTACVPKTKRKNVIKKYLVNDENNRSDVLHFIPDHVFSQLADKASQNPDAFKDAEIDDNEILDFLKETMKYLSPDIAMFGRMEASSPKLTVNSACQFAHSFSIDKVDIETDYFSAIDDLATNQASGHISDNDFSSSCHYRYFNIDTDMFMKNLNVNIKDLSQYSLAQKYIKDFIYYSIRTIPQGKISSTAHACPPQFVLITKTSERINLCGAFENPIYAHQNCSISETGIKKLISHFDNTVEDMCVSIDDISIFLSSSIDESILGKHVKQKNLKETIKNIIKD